MSMSRDTLLGEIANLAADVELLSNDDALEDQQRLTFAQQVGALRTLYAQVKAGKEFLIVLPPALLSVKTAAERARLEQLQKRYVKELQS